jgi:hypothetical protein
MQCAKTLTPRTSWYVEGNSESTPPPHSHCLKGQRSAQARNAETAGGAKDRSRSAVTGAAWRRATLESLTAARWDEIMFLNVPAGFC